MPADLDPLDARPARVAPVTLQRIGAALGDGVRWAGADPASVEVTGVTNSSGAVRPGDLYAAVRGARVHGADFSAAAVASGARAVLTDEDGVHAAAEAGVPVVVVPDPRSRLGEIAAQVYDHPANRLTTIGVTGTQGKTTATFLAEAALRATGARPSLVGTIGTHVAGRPVASSLTTPEAPALHALFAVMAEQGSDACAMEVSSHALVMGRVDAVVFDVAVFLNLGRDHLDFHGDVEDYFAAKSMLFEPEHARRAVVNVDDPYGRRLAASTALPTVTFSATGGEAEWRAVDVAPGPTSSRARLLGPDGAEVRLFVPIPGTFNVANALAVVAAAVTVGYPPDQVAEGIASCSGVPGRMERVDAGQDFVAVVDYAHKPDAIRAVLESLRDQVRGRLVIVLGAGGDRDRGKRPLMGATAAALADLVVVTDDNPRSEDPATIRRAIIDGIAETGRSGARVVEIGGRADAIAWAVAQAGTDDVLVIAGKGHEQGQEIAGEILPFDDRDALRAALRDREGADR